MATELTALDYLTRSVDRNRYFYGKLMTARDFLREQEYFNSKRWLVNRLLFGSGIVCGLGTTTVGGGSGGATEVEIQTGVAFDPVGREITVLERARVDLTKVDASKATEGMPPTGQVVTDVFVCLNFHECPKEPVPSLGGSPCAEACESNRVGETYTVTLIPAPPKGEAPWPCEKWLNRQTVRRPKDKSEPAGDFQVERVAPVWVRQGEVFEVALKVTALKDMTNVMLNETVAGGELVEPDPQSPAQFPTTPVSLRKGEFFIYVYQVKARDTLGKVQLSGVSGVPTPTAQVDVIDDTAAKARDEERHLGACPAADPEEKGVPIARVKATFDAKKLTGFTGLDTIEQQRFRYSLTQVAELMDCVRASLRAEADSPRPGHLFITFKDLEQNDLKPIGPEAAHGTANTVTRGDHVHALLLYDNSGLQFQENKLRIEGNVGGTQINFLNPVSGQEPTEPQHLTTRNYVDSRIAGLDWQESVLTRKLDSPPPPQPAPGPEYPDGARYLIPGNPGAKSTSKNWNKHPGEIATWDGKAKTWVFTAPDEGTAVFVDDENIAYLFVEGKWIPFLATPDVAAGFGLYAKNAVLNVGQGPGLKVNENDVEVVYRATAPTPVGPTSSAGTSPTSARGDHTHDLPLMTNGGLAFGPMTGPEPGPEVLPSERPAPRQGLQVNGPVAGTNIDFLNPVLGQSPVEPRHLATKQYVDGVAAGLDWQNSVLDKDRTAPPPTSLPGARYLVLSTGPAGGTPRVTGAPSATLEKTTGSARDEAEGLRPPTDPDPIPPPPPDLDPSPPPKTPWTGHTNHIATWTGSAWTFIVPNEGMAVFVEDENTAYLFVDGSWTPFMAMPSVAAGAGLKADGARLSVGQGNGLQVNENDVEVVYHANNPTPVGPSTSAGGSTALARGDHTHELPLLLSGGLEFVPTGRPEDEKGEPIREGEEDRLPGSMRLRVNGRLNGDSIEFLNPVLGQDPLEPRHLATKQYVDGVTAGLTWQNTVLDKDETNPPKEPTKGDRYLLFEKPAGDTPWDGRQGTIATWAGKRWEFTAPNEGMATFVADENLAYLYADGNWVPFLAPPAAVGAGDGLIQQGTDLAVGQGEGVKVTADTVSVHFGDIPPLPIGNTTRVGIMPNAARSDHTHQLPLAKDGGLVYAGSKPTDVNVDIPTFLQIDGPVSGGNIDFRSPVSGQTPLAPRHLATKEYVDSKGGGAGAGAGLISQGNVISVVGGPGLVVGPDEVHVNFNDGSPQPVALVSNPGTSNTVARGDHVHAMPDVWGTNVATGVVAFNMRLAGKAAHVTSLPIDPGLGFGMVAVVVGLESEVPDEGTFVGEVDNFEDAMLEGGGFRRYPPVLLGADIRQPTIRKGLARTTFRIWAQATPRAGFLPDNFRVRWWAYRPGTDLGVIDYTPTEQSGGSGGTVFDR